MLPPALACLTRVLVFVYARVLRAGGFAWATIGAVCELQTGDGLPLPKIIRAHEKTNVLEAFVGCYGRPYSVAAAGMGR
jgi:hypothetical protein